MADIEDTSEVTEGHAGEAKRATTDTTRSAGQPPDRLEAHELDEREAKKSPQRRAAGPSKDEAVPDDADVPDVPATEVGEP